MPTPSSPKPKGKTCERCKTWYRPNKFRSAGPNMEYCSLKCMKKAAAEAEIKREVMRDW